LVVHVSTPLDPLAFNDSDTDPTAVTAVPQPVFTFDPPNLSAAQPSSLALGIPSVYPHDLSGTVSLTFVPANLPGGTLPDDPAIQFATGGRVVSFTIPANTLDAVFEPGSEAGPIGFQPGTVAGALAFEGVLQAGAVTSTFAPAFGVAGLAIPLQPPSIRTLETKSVAQPSSNNQPVNVVTARITLLSTMREVSELTMTFDTTPTVRLSCGDVSDCTTRGNSMTFFVKPIFDDWFGQNPTFVSMTTLNLRLSVSGSNQGTITIALRNSSGFSNTESFNLP
jgi:hypothetical protein